MFKFVSRSKSVKSGQPTHGPGLPTSLGDDSPVSSRQTSKQDVSGSQNEALPSPPIPNVGVSGRPGGPPALQPSSPPYPFPSRAPTLLERPSTSSGSGSNKSNANTKDFGKRKSKDDLALMTRDMARGDYRSYHIPIRGKPPSPSENGRDVPMPPMIPVRTQTPESFSDNNAIITIGMAIGSPTHPPIASYGSNWPPPAVIGVATSTPDSTAETEQGTALAPAPQRSKSTRWRLFGRSKSKRTKPEAPQAQGSLASSEGSAAAGTESTGRLDRSNTEKSAPKRKPPTVRTEPESLAQSPADAVRYYASPSQPNKLTGGPLEASAPVLGPSAGPLLDVEIPDITMERYSVMFGGLLQANTSSSSLLARRQATLERLRSINDRIVQEQETRDHTRVRRATSPSPDKSPLLSMFPTPPPTVPLSTSPRLRSATLPSGLPSNPRDGSHDRKRRTQLQLEVPVKTSPGLQDGKAEKRLERFRHAPEQPWPQAQPLSQTSTSSLAQSNARLDSPAEEQRQELHVLEHLRPTIYEPKWEMVSPSESATARQNSLHPPVDATQTSASEGAALDESLSSPRSDQRHERKTSEEEFDEAMLNAAVEISIARQISISQQQRDMLRKNIGGAGTGARRMKVPRGDRSVPTTDSGSSAQSVSKNKRLAVTKTATPTFITPPETFLGSPLAQHRKSERIIVEGA